MVGLQYFSFFLFSFWVIFPDHGYSCFGTRSRAFQHANEPHFGTNDPKRGTKGEGGGAILGTMITSALVCTRVYRTKHVHFSV